MNSLYEKDEASLAKILKLRFSPLTVASGEGSYVVDEDGRRVLDLSSSWGAASLGYGHPNIVEAVENAARTMAGASVASYPNPEAVAVAERLLKHVPTTGSDRRVWLGHSGASANDTLVRTVSAATGRSVFVSFVGSMHGLSAGSMSVSVHPAAGTSHLRPGLMALPYPNAYRPPFDGDPNGDRILEYFEYLLGSAIDATEIAAVIFEPIMSDGGVLIPPQGFLKRIEEICRPHGILTISDEVKVGVGRTGKFNAFEHDDITPDLVVLGKGLGGGLPMSAIVGPAEILDFNPAFALQTTNGNPVCSAAARATLDTIVGDGLERNAEERGVELVEDLRELAVHHELIGDVRGRGLIAGVELVSDRTSKTPARDATAKVVFRASELGLVLFYVGLQGNVLEFTPALNISSDEIKLGVEVLDQALGDVESGRVADEAVAAFAGW